MQPVKPPPPQPVEVWDTNPFIWGTTRNNSLLPDPGWFRKQHGVVGGTSMNPYTTSYAPRQTELDFRTAPLSKWVKPYQ